eukprot:gene7798-992_t
MTLLAAAIILAFSALFFFILYLAPSRILRAASTLFPDVLFYVPQRKAASPKLVALTIDDSCDATLTDEAAELLGRYQAHATFFVIGSHVEAANATPGAEGKGQAILEQLVRGGHELGNHTWYDRPSIRLSTSVLKDELERVQQQIDLAHKAAGVPRSSLQWFRPGCGWFSASMLGLTKSLGYRTVLGDVFPYDPQSLGYRTA